MWERIANTIVATSKKWSFLFAILSPTEVYNVHRRIWHLLRDDFGYFTKRTFFCFAFYITIIYVFFPIFINFLISYIYKNIGYKISSQYYSLTEYTWHDIETFLALLYMSCILVATDDRKLRMIEDGDRIIEIIQSIRRAFDQYKEEERKALSDIQEQLLNDASKKIVFSSDREEYIGLHQKQIDLIHQNIDRHLARMKNQLVAESDELEDILSRYSIESIPLDLPEMSQDEAIKYINHVYLLGKWISRGEIQRSQIARREYIGYLQ
ncbi:hypothetical protein FXW31_01390 [Candidatus Liberibacter asiaticus]|nr:hypothetical protein FXW31_01390 [Candidatus Liberibacter asiaticus]